MKNLFVFTILLLILWGCDTEKNEMTEIGDIQTGKLPGATILPEGYDIKKLHNPVAEPPGLALNRLKSGSANIRFGVWYPYISNNGVPPFSELLENNIEAQLITGNIDTTTMKNFDVIFIGRGGTIGKWPWGAGIITDIDALINWINEGGSIIGESESLIYDSDVWRGVNWSSRLSQIAGVWSSNPQGGDWPCGNEIVYITRPDHPVAEGLGSSFQFDGYSSGEVGAYLDTTRNPSAVMVARMGGMPVVASRYGAGHSVYFPIAVGWNPVWNQNPGYTKLFINAIKWCGPKTIQITIDVMPGTSPNYFNNNGHGVLPVAVWGSNTFDINLIDVSSIKLNDLPVNQVTKGGKYQAYSKDVNLDGFNDLVLQMDDVAGLFSTGTVIAVMTGKLNNGVSFKGSDEIIVKSK